MADLKISQLTSATTPLAGTEVVPLVQSGTTKKVTVDNLTASKVTAVTSTDNATVRFNGTAGQVQNSGVIIDDSNNITASNPAGVATLILDGNGSTNGGRVAFYADIAGSGNKFRSAIDGINIGNSGSGLSFKVIASGNTEPVEQMRLDYLNNLTLTSGNLIIGTSGKGIDFSATSGTGTSELFADYEEGTWTPVLRFGGGSTDITYNTQQGTYTKVGRTVTIRFEISLSNKGTSTGGASIAGLPFATANLNSMAVYLYSGFSSTYKVGIAYLDASVIDEIAANGTGAFNDTQFTNTSRFWATCTYQV